MQDTEKMRKVRELLERAKALSPHVERATVPLYGINARNHPEVLGTGVLLLVEPSLLVLTAAHVLDELEKSDHYVGLGGELIPLVVRKNSTRTPLEGRDGDRLDLAYFVLGGSLRNATAPDEPISIDELDLDLLPSTDQAYLVAGFPISKQPGKPKPGATPQDVPTLDIYPRAFLAKGKSPEEYDKAEINPLENLILGFKRDEMWIEDGRATYPKPYGHSGGGIWRVPSFRDASPQTAKLSGIAVKWREKQGQIIGTRIEHVLSEIARHNDSFREALRMRVG